MSNLRTLGYLHAIAGAAPQRSEPDYLAGWRFGCRCAAVLT